MPAVASEEDTTMKQYLLSVYQPDGEPPPEVAWSDHARRPRRARRRCARPAPGSSPAGCTPPSTATVVRVEDGEVLITDGPFVEGKEHLGGFTIIQAPDLDAALGVGRQAGRGDHAADRGAAVRGHDEG